MNIEDDIENVNSWVNAGFDIETSRWQDEVIISWQNIIKYFNLSEVIKSDKQYN